jgi:glycosyltransferase involved in cell wall biosynthesis
MHSQKLLSVVVNNYNYGRFVGSAITSALDQNPELTEVVVVDDGSTDNSRDVINHFGDRTTTVFKQNGGQASALNAGFQRAAGRWIIFLDADDILLDNCAERLAAVLEPDASKITWSMPIIGPNGGRRMGTTPAHPPASGDLRQCLIDRGPLAFDYAPCSGNAWSRRFLEAVLPIPEETFRQGADGYLVHLSPLHGRSVVSDKPLSAYRRHESNFLAAKNQFDMRDELRQRHPVLVDILARHMERCGLSFDRSNWCYEYWDQLDEFEAALLKHVPEDQSLILVDDNALNIGHEFHGRTCQTLTDQDGRDIGAPENGDLAVRRLRALNQKGVRYLVFMWHSFWWLECYPEMRHYLDASAAELHRSDTSVIYRLHDDVA